jgi:methyl-accepting chemotaxis protein
MLIIGLVLLALAAIVSVLIARTITRPVSRLTDAMAEIAADRLEVAVPGLDRADELGLMADAVEVFRSNGIKMRELRAVELDMSEERASQVNVIRACSRISARWSPPRSTAIFRAASIPALNDPELVNLAQNVNGLVASVDRGLTETGTVLGALAKADLSVRMTGEYKGAFAQLKADTNAMAEQLSGIVTQLRGTSGALKTATGDILGRGK